jgi:hypothetical protein
MVDLDVLGHACEHFVVVGCGRGVLPLEAFLLDCPSAVGGDGWEVIEEMGVCGIDLREACLVQLRNPKEQLERLLDELLNAGESCRRV